MANPFTFLFALKDAKISQVARFNKNQPRRASRGLHRLPCRGLTATGHMHVAEVVILTRTLIHTCVFTASFP